jgi:hypothetical protein
VTDDDTLAFIRASLKSVWALELLLLLKRHPDRSWHGKELVRELRASEMIVTEALNNLQAAGFVSDEAGGTFRYRHEATALTALADAVDQLYRAKPMAAINAIMSAPDRNLRIFSDAFKLRDN